MDVSAIFVGDMHLREDTPECRKDDYVAVQTEKLAWLSSLQEKHAVPVLCPGDVFHKARPSYSLLSYAFHNLPNDFICVPGNHDLPQHSLMLLGESALGVLAAMNDKRQVLLDNPAFHKGGFTVFPMPYGSEPADREIGGRNSLLLVHRMIWKGKVPFPNAERIGVSAETMLNEYPNIQMILSGDNHTAFEVESGGRKLINPGSFMAMTADQDKHRPSVYLWDANTNETERVEIPIAEEISCEHLFTRDEKDIRLSSFVDRLNKDIEIELSFEDNLKRFFGANEIETEVQQKVWEIVA